MRLPSCRSLVLSLLAGTALSSPAFSLDPSGSAVRVDRLTDAAGPGGTRVLESQGPVFMGDAITTNPNGLAQIRFIDDTKIVVGPNSSLVIDRFVFNPDNTAREVTVSVAKGVFRFISGNSPNEAYSIQTPTMTIGIRGTVMDGHVHSGGSRIVFLEGGGEGCDAGGDCEELVSGCRLYYAPFGGGIETPEGLDRRLQMSAYFPFVGDQNSLDPDFRAQTTSCTLADNRILEGPPDSSTQRNSDGEGPPRSPPSPPPPPPYEGGGEEEF